MSGAKGVAAVGLIGLLASLAWYANKKPNYVDTRHLERPPPQPPHCPDLPELKNITLKNGAVADVRIVQFRNTKMYFPVDLVESAFIDGERDARGFIDSHPVGKQYEGMAGGGAYLRKFDPDIYSVECPGIVHHLVENGASLWPILLINDGPLRVDRPRAKNIKYSEDIGAIFFTSHMEPNSQNRAALGRFYAMRGFFNDNFVWRSELEVMVAGDKQYISRWQHSKSINEFIIWLNTPPAKRDNDTIFTLKVDEKLTCTPTCYQSEIESSC